MNTDNRHIRIFISSVFEGMQEEREYLRTKFLPKAQNLCKRYAVSLTLIDLRWGITDQDVADQMVLERLNITLKRTK